MRFQISTGLISGYIIFMVANHDLAGVVPNMIYSWFSVWLGIRVTYIIYVIILLSAHTGNTTIYTTIAALYAKICPQNVTNFYPGAPNEWSRLSWSTMLPYPSHLFSPPLHFVVCRLGS